MADVLKDAHATVARFGGEEFSVLLTGVSEKEALRIAENLRRRIEEEEIILRRQKTHVTASIGIAGLSKQAITEDDLIRKADAALYQAKKKGRNRICYI